MRVEFDNALVRWLSAHVREARPVIASLLQVVLLISDCFPRIGIARHVAISILHSTQYCTMFVCDGDFLSLGSVRRSNGSGTFLNVQH